MQQPTLCSVLLLLYTAYEAAKEHYRVPPMTTNDTWVLGKKAFLQGLLLPAITKTLKQNNMQTTS